MNLNVIVHWHWMNMGRDLQALHREHVVIVSLSHKVTAWRREVTTAWMCHVLLARFLLRSSFIEATLHHKERMAADLLAFHSFTLLYTSAYSLIRVLWGVYRRQVSTIGGVWLNLREATPSTAHKTCEFLNSMRLLLMLHPLSLFLLFFSFVWSLLIHYLKFRCGPPESWQVSSPAYIVQY